MLRHLSVRFGSLFRRERLEQELDTELRYHLDMLDRAAHPAGDVARRRAPRSAPRLRRGRSRQGRGPRQLAGAVLPGRRAGHPLRRAQPAPEQGLRARHRRHHGARHRRQHRDLQRRQRRAAAPAALSRRRQDRRPAPRAGGRSRQRHGLLGQGHRRLPARPLVHRHRRVPRHVLQPARPRRAGAGVDRRRVGELLRRARREAAPRPHVRRARRYAGRAGGAGPEQPILGAQLRRRSEHRRPGVPDERQAAHRGRRPAAGAAVSARRGRLHALVGVPVPIVAADDRGAAGADADRVRAGPAGRDGKQVAGGPRHRRGPAREGVPGRLSADRVSRARGPAQGRADPQLQADAVDPARDGWVRPADRLRVDRQPAAGADGAARARDLGPRGARRDPGAAAAAAADREPAARRHRRIARAGAVGVHAQAAGRLYRALHGARARDHDRPQRAVLHARRLGPDRPDLRIDSRVLEAARHGAGAARGRPIEPLEPARSAAC